MAIPIAVQLYSLREDAAKDFTAVLKSVAKTGYKGVELAGYNNLTPAEVGKIVKDLGMEVEGGHMGVPDKDSINKVVDDCKVLGCTRVVGGYGNDQFDTEANCLKFSAILQESAELCKKHGLELGLHNHWCEFDHDFGGKTPHTFVMENAPSVFSELDVYWCKYGGVEPIPVLKKYPGRFTLLHAKDGNLETPPVHTAVGHGKLDFPGIVAAAEAAGTKALVVELDSCATDMAQAVKDSYTYLVSNGLAAGNK